MLVRDIATGQILVRVPVYSDSALIVVAFFEHTVAKFNSINLFSHYII